MICLDACMYYYREGKKMLPHSASVDEVRTSLKTDITRGLTASEVSERLEKFGNNVLKGKKKDSLLKKFLLQFKDAMIIILIAAAAVSFGVAVYNNDTGEFIEPALILLIVVINAVIGVVQESKAERALEALKQMSAPHARVIRDGTEQLVDASGLVPGDIIKLEAGDFVPADSRLISSSNLKCEESALTGESVPAEKSALAEVAENAPLGDRANMVYSGCSVSYGTALAVVTATGMSTEMGKIAELLNTAEETQTPLQEKLSKLGKYLGIIALAACAVIFVLGLLNDIDVMEIFMTSVSLAVSAIPEGLPAIITIVLSIGVQRMVRRNAIIRSLPAVETLGSASVICSDKTGTLTQNRMTLVEAFADGEASAEKIGDGNSEKIRKLLGMGTLCCDGSIVPQPDGTFKHIGDPTETSIVLAAHMNGMEKSELNARYPRMAEIPFDSDRKLMTTVNNVDGKLTVIVKGAFDVLAGRCVAGNTALAAEMVNDMSSRALRVIAVAYKHIDELPSDITPDTMETGLTFFGVVGMIDPPRKEAAEAVQICTRAGIRPVMITGDHVVTACAIAKQLGILRDGDRAVTGAELAAMSDEQLDDCVDSISVYARVTPEDKIRIVRAWQKRGKVVSMTGDGDNDAPALKAADIGCAMGITGTDVAKGAADMTLTDDNFATIVHAVREGRGIYDNIKKAVGFLLGTNIGELLTVFIAMLLWHESPLLSIQLLWINLVTDSLPAIAIGMESVESDVMDRSPKPKNEGLFANGHGLRIAIQGVFFASVTLAAYMIGSAYAGVEGGSTMAFLVLALSQVFHSFNMRSHFSLFKIGVFTNRKLDIAALISIALMALVTFVPPVADAFGLVSLDWVHYLIALGLSLLSVPLMELAKLFGLVRP